MSRTAERNEKIERVAAIVLLRLAAWQRAGRDVAQLHHQAAAHVWSDRRGGRLTAIRTGLEIARARELTGARA